MKGEELSNSSYGTPYLYIKVILEVEAHSVNLTALSFQAFVAEAVKQLFGEYGRASIKVDVLHYDNPSQIAILKVMKSSEAKLRSALTLYGKYGELDCRFRVLQTSNSLNGLSHNSREHSHQLNT